MINECNPELDVVLGADQSLNASLRANCIECTNADPFEFEDSTFYWLNSLDSDTAGAWDTLEGYVLASEVDDDIVGHIPLYFLYDCLFKYMNTSELRRISPAEVEVFLSEAHIARKFIAYVSSANEVGVRFSCLKSVKDSETNEIELVEATELKLFKINSTMRINARLTLKETEDYIAQLRRLAEGDFDEVFWSECRSRRDDAITPEGIL